MQNTSAHSKIQPLNARSILDAVADGQELPPKSALHLLSITDEDELHQLRECADTFRQRQVGETVWYTHSDSLYLTNRCEMNPILYPYARNPGDPSFYIMTIDDIDAFLEQATERRIQQLYVSGGFWPFLEIPGLETPTLLKTYSRFLAYLSEQKPTLRLVGFSPDEVDFLCIVSDRSVQYVLELLKDQGLQTLGGQGAEILSDTVRRRIAPKKTDVARWFKIAAMAHRLEIPVIAKIEAGPMETLRQRINHLKQLRDFQQKHPNAFCCLVPQLWTRAPKETAFPMPGLPFCKPLDRFKLSAVMRLFLGVEIPEQTVFWQPNGVNEAQEGLQWGANALGGTDALAYIEFLSGSQTPDHFSDSDFQQLITETGRSAQKH